MDARIQALPFDPATMTPRARWCDPAVVASWAAELPAGHSTPRELHHEVGHP